MRLLKEIDKYTASKSCKFERNTIGFIENGRVTLTEKKIRHIVETYGFTMELFQQILKQSFLRHELIEQCQELVSRLDENKLRVIFPMLQSMASSLGPHNQPVLDQIKTNYSLTTKEDSHELFNQNRNNLGNGSSRFWQSSPDS